MRIVLLINTSENISTNKYHSENSSTIKYHSEKEEEKKVFKNIIESGVNNHEGGITHLLNVVDEYTSILTCYFGCLIPILTLISSFICRN